MGRPLLALAILLVGLVSWAACAHPNPATPPIAPSDREILQALYKAAAGVRWAHSSNWLTDRPLGEWYGVTVDHDARVIELDLHRNQLSGWLPPELGKLTNLEDLNLSFNFLRGKIPPELGILPNLERLVLNENELSGNIPLVLGNLPKLEILALGGNRLFGRIPPELGDLSTLKYLYLYDNSLQGDVPPELGHLPHLTRLNLEGNKLTGCLPTNWQDQLEQRNSRLSGLPFCDS